ncbi:helicase-associated domain-containing protein [Actinoplanes sp. NPDC023714]|uniref:helicase-associated domain-containing protein n=1 Tax=Actinoplanes sp. NPDC023714 TaxID=3154322 RepID=UPI0033F3D4CD
MSASDRLAAHLRGLNRSQLIALIAARAVTEPAPASLEQLAAHLLRPESITSGLETCTLPELQLAELIATLGDRWSVDRLAGLLCVPADDPDLAGVLSSLFTKGLVWPGGGAHLRAAWPHPFGLGPGAADLLAQLSVTQVRMIAERVGAPLTGRSKQVLISDVADWLAVPENVRDLVMRAPVPVRDSLCASAERPAAPSSWRRPVDAPRWAVERGLVIPSGWNGGQMPAEVALALRHIPFSPRPPFPGVSPPDFEAAVEREASAAATDVLGLFRAAADVFARTPVAVLANGGIGVKEMRRVAKAIGRGEDAARFALEIAAAGGLVSSSAEGLTLSASFPDFAALEPASQLVALVSTWLSMPACPLSAGASVLDWDRRSAAVLVALRPAVLRFSSGDPSRAAALVAWHSPMVAEQAAEDLDRFVAGIHREAHLLGLMAHGRMSELGRLLIDGADLRERAVAMVPPAVSRVVLQNDLTAVVTGTPTASLMTLLDSLADPESRGGAWTWRFSPSSVRRAFDDGADADSLTARLAEVADRVPQGLEYLIKDVGRLHGRVQVRAVGCVLCSSDAILLDEIVASRALAALHLVRLAPTVVASGKPPAETLVALRDSGYAPSSVREEAAVLDIARPAEPSPVPIDSSPPPSRVDPEALADILLG